MISVPFSMCSRPLSLRFNVLKLRASWKSLARSWRMELWDRSIWTMSSGIPLGTSVKPGKGGRESFCQRIYVVATRHAQPFRRERSLRRSVWHRAVVVFVGEILVHHLCCATLAGSWDDKMCLWLSRESQAARLWQYHPGSLGTESGECPTSKSCSRL